MTKCIFSYYMFNFFSVVPRSKPFLTENESISSSLFTKDGKESSIYTQGSINLYESPRIPLPADSSYGQNSAVPPNLKLSGYQVNSISVQTDSCVECIQLQSSSESQHRKRGRKPGSVLLKDPSKVPLGQLSKSFATKIKEKLLRGRKKKRKVGRPRTRPLEQDPKVSKIIHRKKSHARLTYGKSLTHQAEEDLMCNNVASNGDNVISTIESVIRNVCSEYEPLPFQGRKKSVSVLDSDDEEFDNDGDDDDEYVPSKHVKKNYLKTKYVMSYVSFFLSVYFFLSNNEMRLN